MENINDGGISAQHQDTPDPLAPMENNSELTPDTDNEMDADELIHEQSGKVSEENKAGDPDDAVHKIHIPQAPDENEERDPDDAVHGL